MNIRKNLKKQPENKRDSYQKKANRLYYEVFIKL